MTPAKTDHTHLNWLVQAGSAASIVPIARFVGLGSTFALKGAATADCFPLRASTKKV